MALYNTRLKSEHTDTEELNKAKKMVYKYKTGLAARVKMYIFYQARWWWPDHTSAAKKCSQWTQRRILFCFGSWTINWEICNRSNCTYWLYGAHPLHIKFGFTTAAVILYARMHQPLIVAGPSVRCSSKRPLHLLQLLKQPLSGLRPRVKWE